jgi:hypothetical protein
MDVKPKLYGNRNFTRNKRLRNLEGAQNNVS